MTTIRHVMRISWYLTVMFLDWGHNKDHADISWFVVQYILLQLIAVTTMTTMCVFDNFDILDLDQNKLLTFRGSALPSLLLPPHDNFSTWGKYLSWPRSGDRVGAFL